MKITSFKNLNIYKNLFKKDVNNREINIYKIDNCLAHGVNLYYPNVLFNNISSLYLPLLEKTMSLKESYYESNNMEYNIITKKTNITYEEPLFFFCYNVGNYYHFLYDTLPYLISYLKLKKEIKNLKLLINYVNENKKEHYKFVLEFLELLNIKEEDLIIINDNILYKEIYISTSYTHDINSNLPPRKEIFDLYQLLVKNLKNLKNINIFNIFGSSIRGDIKLYDNIYISRRTHLHNKLDNIGTNYTDRRKLVNEDELVEKLIKEGYKEIFTENLNTIEKILLFNNAKKICGCIGGGIANVVFCKKDAILEAIISPDFLNINNRFKYCLEWVNVNYNYNTEHVEKGEFKKYMRVKYKDIIGEIIDYDEENIEIKVSDKGDTGWDFKKEYNILKLKKEDVEKLDNGLNSIFILAI
jgi:hypothetical protein